MAAKWVWKKDKMQQCNGGLELIWWLMGLGKIWGQWVKGSDFMGAAGEGFNWAGLISDL